MSVKVSDEKLKTRLVRFGPKELYVGKDMQKENDFPSLFDRVWNERLQEAVDRIFLAA